mgnify:CR=1 FL=1
MKKLDQLISSSDCSLDFLFLTDCFSAFLIFLFRVSFLGNEWDFSEFQGSINLGWKFLVFS